MTHGARTQEEIYQDLLDKLTGKISTLTNFTTNSFNYVWAQAFAERLREQEVKLTVAEFSGWVDYSGGPITDEDLQDLGIENDVSVEDVEPFLSDTHLDELVKLVGVTRDLGTEATGTVTFTTQSASTTIPIGTEVGTQPDSSGSFNRYATTEQVSTGSGVTTVSAAVKAVDVGQEFNTGAGTVTYLPNPPGGVQRVTNANAIDGGEDRESNDDLRQRAKDAVFRSSGGGTVEGIIGYIEENTPASEVTIIEFPSGDAVRNYPHAHVVVSGGSDQEILDAIEASRPAAVEHVLRRPNSISLNITVNVEGTDVDTSKAELRITEFLNDLGLDEDLFEDRLIYIVMGADADIDNIASFDYTVGDEAFAFDPSQDVYVMQLDDEMLDDGITQVTGTEDAASYTFIEDTDYQEWNSTAGDTSSPQDALDWSIGRTQTTETIAYSAGTTEYALSNDLVHNGISSVQNTTTATTLTEGTDWEHADTNSDNLQDGIRFLNAQNDGDSIDVTYDYGNLPDVLANQTYSDNFKQETDKYNIDDAMIVDGITEVTGTLNGNPHTFVEGVDYDEWDSNGDNSPEGIDWSLGGDRPDDDTSFTVTYDSGTQFLVDYDIREGDISLNASEKFDAGDINVTVI